jgi:O-antigen/teichoic acid export membrane protein
LNNPANLTSGRVLTRSAIWNLIGEAAPFAVALIVVPILVHRLGAARYGVLTLAWLTVGYFGLFDLGLGRATTKFIADAAGSGARDRVGAIAWISVLLMAVFGTIGAIVMGLVSRWLVYRVLDVPPALRLETLHSFYLLALALPIIISSSPFNGVLAAFQRFDLINAVRVAFGFFSFLGPLMVLPFSHSIFWIVAVLLAGRCAAWLASLVLCLNTVPELRCRPRLTLDLTRRMLRFGGWLTVSGVTSPLMVYFDRFLIGSMISVAAVTYYSVPYNVATKILIVPSALVGVLFPAFASALIIDRNRVAALFDRGIKYLVLAIFPATLIASAFAPEALVWWLGADFAGQSAAVMRWIAVGVFVNCLAHLPYALVQAVERPDLTAKFHLAEVPIYFVMLWVMVPRFGIVGIAIAWTVRTVIDALALFIAAGWLLPEILPQIVRTALMTIGALVAIALCVIPAELIVRAATVAVILCAFALLAMRMVGHRERATLLANLRLSFVFAPK